MTSPLERLLDRVESVGIDSAESINPFWARQRADAKASGLPLREFFKSSVQFGYNSEPLGPGETNADLFGALPDQSPDGLHRYDIEHIGALNFLRQRGVMQEHFAIADAFGIRSDMRNARHFWYARLLRTTLAEQQIPTPAVFLEIGAGSGHFAHLCIDAGLVRHYVLVDLPAMLVNSMSNLVERFPDALAHFGERPDFASPGLHLWFFDTFDMTLVPDCSVDVALNFNSFGEMDRDVRDRYIAEVYRTTRAGGLFYNVNRNQTGMTMRDGSTYDNNPLLYPYAASDRIIDWVLDEFQTAYRARTFQGPARSFAISRRALV